MVQLGVGGDVPVPLTAVVAKEICWMGSFRFHEEFAWAAKLISGGQLDVSPLLSETVPVEDAARAFELAGDRSRAVKVQIAF
ncbi:MAG: hypothetical protein GWN79_00455 [Actinobacteria bacterium]|nr:hypothetical protein [Actinomycetota bacterium]NIT94023.1 hypothetical protein [Actinomycetota bacterium]NIU17654.1 hypothetical protein [Actinomycetota bacterium]NIU64048.1 hypothetical protein [Actinomycetota bacterium]NIV54162.1 hypothetical protein [Actinomycetota bacterium]